MKIPQILFTVYQHVFNSIYMLSSILNTPYPPPDLLHPMAEKIQILQTPSQQQPEKTEAPAQPPIQPASTPASATPTAAPATDTSEKAATTAPAASTSENVATTQT